MSRNKLMQLAPVGTIGRFDVLGRLASGGMAEVFLAREGGARGASRLVAIKRLLSAFKQNEEVMDMFVQEASLCMRLRHPNICTIYEFGEEDGTPFLAMEWVHGVPLDVLIESGAVPLPLTLKVFSDVAGALHAAHSMLDDNGKPLGIIHRDVTPENILIGYDGVARLVDFGIAKITSHIRSTQLGELKGKIPYMAPEQYQQEEIDSRVDLFSLGTCLYETLVGESLFLRESQYETVAAIVLDKSVPSVVEKKPELPQEVDDILARTVARDREDRFSSAKTLRDAIDRLSLDQGFKVKEADLAYFLRSRFADEIDSGPGLDRDGLSIDRSQGLSLTERASLDADLDAVEADLDRDRRGKRRVFNVLAIIIALGVIGLVAYAVYSDPAVGIDRVGEQPIEQPNVD